MPQISRQLWILGVALLLGSLWGELTLGAALASYLGAWVLFNWGGWSKIEPPKAPRPVALAALLLLLAGPLLAILGQGRARALAIREGLHGLGEHLQNRLRIEQRPAIAPPLVVGDAPQVFHVHAPTSGHVKVSFGGEALAAVDLGHGLFRVAYDPRRDGPPRGPARILVDGEAFEREVAVVERAAHPRWLVADPARGVAAAVSEETDTLYLLERSGRLRAVPVGDGPADVALFDGGRRAVVAHRHEAALFLVDVEAGQVIGRHRGNPFITRLAVSGSGRLLAASTDGERRGVIVAELPDARPTGFAPLPWTPDWLTFADDETLVVAVREPRALVRLARRGERWEQVGDLLHLGRPVVTATRRPGASRWYLATTAYRPDGGMPEGNHFVQDQILTVDLARFAVVDQLLTARGDARQDEPGNVESGASPMGLDLREDGSLLVAFAGTDEVWRVPPDRHLPEVLLDARVSGVSIVAPHGVADLGEGRFAVTSPAAGTLAVLEGDGRLVAMHRVAPADEELAARDPAALARRQGERGFYEATRSGVSCQSCHLHGAHDHSAHDITSRGKEISILKGTLSTLGIAGTAPYLRGGNFPHIGDLDDVARDRYQGYRRAAADRPALLEAFVNSLPLPLNPRALPQEREGDTLEVERERRGVAAFVKARCDLCHAFPAFSNLGQHPARALFPQSRKMMDGAVLDTPSLLGLRASAPYLVDGRAATLEAVLREHNPDNRHGDTAALSDPEIADLVHFLESL